MTTIWLILIIPGLIVAYAMILRPILHKVSAFGKFYSEADGFWGKVWAACDKSATMAWSYVLGGIGSFFALIDRIGPVIGDPSLNLQQKVTDTLQANPKIMGYVLIGISIVTLLARIRTLTKQT